MALYDDIIIIIISREVTLGIIACNYYYAWGEEYYEYPPISHIRSKEVYLMPFAIIMFLRIIE